MKHIQVLKIVLRHFRPWMFACAFVVSGGASVVVMGLPVLIMCDLLPTSTSKLESMLFGAFYAISNLMFVITVVFGIAAVIVPVAYLKRCRFRDFGIAVGSLLCAMILVIATFPLTGPLFMASGLIRERMQNSNAKVAPEQNASCRMEFMIEECVDGKMVYVTNAFENGKLEKPLN